MNLARNLRWALMATSIASGHALAVAVDCTVTPVNSIITEGQTLQLQATCDGALTHINWKMDGTSVTGEVALAGHEAAQPLYYTTPVGLGGANAFAFTVTGTPAAGNTWNSSSTATVVVKPSSAVVAKAAGSTTPTTPVDATCGSANNTSVSAMPTNGEQCAANSKPALAISGPTSFTWSCASLTGGLEASCSAQRVVTYTVTATDNESANGSVTPLTQSVNGGQSANVTAVPATNYNTSWSSTCGGTSSGNTFTISSVNGNCTVTASFAQQQSTYTVTASAGAGGSISPLGTQTVNANATPGFTVAASSGYTVSGVTGCGGTLNGSTYTTAPVTASCTVSATFTATQSAPPAGGSDPGTGSWWPSADRLIADQTGTGVTINYVPGCLNGDSAINSSTGCAANATNGNFSFGSARTLGLRFTPKAGAGAVKKYFKISSGDGGNVGQFMKVWLSTSPTANYDDAASTCRSTSATVPYILTGPGWCPIDATKKHYLFMSVDATAANPPTWRYQVDEVSADFY